MNTQSCRGCLRILNLGCLERLPIRPVIFLSKHLGHSEMQIPNNELVIRPVFPFCSLSKKKKCQVFNTHRQRAMCPPSPLKLQVNIKISLIYGAKTKSLTQPTFENAIFKLNCVSQGAYSIESILVYIDFSDQYYCRNFSIFFKFSIHIISY